MHANYAGLSERLEAWYFGIAYRRFQYLGNVLTFGPIFAGHLEGGQDALLDVEGQRRLGVARANVNDAAVDEREVKVVTLDVVRNVVGWDVAERNIRHLKNVLFLKSAFYWNFSITFLNGHLFLYIGFFLYKWQLKLWVKTVEDWSQTVDLCFRKRLPYLSTVHTSTTKLKFASQALKLVVDLFEWNQKIDINRLFQSLGLDTLLSHTL